MKILIFGAILPLVIGIVFLTSCGLFDNSDPESEPIVPGDIIFTMADDTEAQNHQIFTMNIDGSGLQQITRFEEHEAFDPAWSPDGSEIVFETNLDFTSLGNSIYLIDADGKNLQPMKVINDFTVSGTVPVWSPDGAKIAFSFGGIPKPDIYIYI